MGSEEEQRILDQIDIAISSLGAALHTPQKVAYVSHFVTSGTRFLEQCEKYGVSTKEELKEIDPSIYKEKIMKPNLDEGMDFGKDIESRGLIAIVPGAFFAKGWVDKHYMTFWEAVIEKYAQSVFFLENFHTSPGGIEELVIAKKLDRDLYVNRALSSVNTLDPLIIDNELPKIETAMKWMQNLGVDYTRTQKAYETLSHI